ncbi:MAG: hypothetical protein AB8B53_13525 [Flavobacteriales bacterium]
MDRVSKDIFTGLKQMPAENDFFNLDWTLKPSELMKIKNGFASSGMDEKWNIYFEIDKLYFHRSWTGTCVYIAKLKELPDESGIITNVQVNRNKEEYKFTDNNEDKTLFKKIVQFQLIDYEPRVKSLNILNNEYDSIRSLIPNEYLDCKFCYYKESLDNLRLTWNGYPTSEYIDMSKTKGIDIAIDKLNTTDLDFANVITTSFDNKMLFVITDESFEIDLGSIEFLENPPMKQ